MVTCLWRSALSLSISKWRETVQHISQLHSTALSPLSSSPTGYRGSPQSSIRVKRKTTKPPLNMGSSSTKLLCRRKASKPELYIFMVTKHKHIVLKPTNLTTLSTCVMLILRWSLVDLYSKFTCTSKITFTSHVKTP
jgi:hypothetical protein